jgi:hypothetical protein
MKKLKTWWSLLKFRWRFFMQNLEMASSVTPQMLLEPPAQQRTMKIRMSIAMQPKTMHPVCAIQQVFEFIISSPDPQYLNGIISTLSADDAEPDEGTIIHPVIKNAVLLTLEEIATNKEFNTFLAKTFSQPSTDRVVLEFFSDYEPIFYKDLKKLRVYTALSDVS